MCVCVCVCICVYVSVCVCVCVPGDAVPKSLGSLRAGSLPSYNLLHATSPALPLPRAACSAFPQVLNLVLGVLIAVLYGLMTALFTAADVDTNPLTGRLLAAVNPRVEVRAGMPAAC